MRVFSVSLAAAALLGGVLAAPAELANGIMAVVNDSVITYGEVDAHTDAPYLYRKYADQPEVFQKELEKVRQQNLDLLVNRQLILHEFNTAGYSLPESVLDEMVQEEIHSQYSDRRTWAKTLQARGESFEKYRQRLRDQYIERALISKNIHQSIIISPHKVEAYYQAHHDDYKVEEQVKLRRINLPQSADTNAPSAEKMAEEIAAKLNGGATFAEMAGLYSQNKQEGEWYDMPSGLLKPLADIATTLQVGQHSGVMSRSLGEDDYWVCQLTNGSPVLGRHYLVEAATRKLTLAGEQKFDSASPATNLPPAQEFFLVLLEDKRPGHYKPLTEMRDKIEEELRLTETARLQKLWMDKLKKKTFVRVFPGG
jgi:peptidyl-prolyl cis-trans isomerase SurA